MNIYQLDKVLTSMKKHDMITASIFLKRMETEVNFWSKLEEFEQWCEHQLKGEECKSTLDCIRRFREETNADEIQSHERF